MKSLRRREAKDLQLNVFSRIIYRMGEVYEDKLKKAGLGIEPEVYGKRALLYLLGGLVISISLSILLYFLYLKTALIALIIYALIVSPVFPIIMYFLPSLELSQKIDSRRTHVTAETPIFAVLFVVYLRTGLSPQRIFEIMSQSSGLSNIKIEAKRVILYIKYFGAHVEKAIEWLLRNSPSQLFNKFIEAYNIAVRSGAPVLTTMQSRAIDLMKEFELIARKAADSVEGIAQGYIIYLASGYTMLFIALLLTGVYPQFSALISVLGAFAVIGMPLLNLAFVLMVDKAQLKFPSKGLNAYKIFAINFPIGLTISIMGLYLSGNLEPLLTLSGTIYNVISITFWLVIGLLVSTIPPAISSYLEIKRTTGYDQYISLFLRAIGEGLRSGIPPEKVIENLRYSKEMGKFTKIINFITSSIKIGLPLVSTFKKATREIRDFLTRTILLSMADMMEAGGMSAESIELLADNVENYERISKEYKQKIKTLLLLPYIGIALSLITVIIISFSIISVITIVPTGSSQITEIFQNVNKVVFISAVSSILNSFLAGFLIGKISGSVSRGFLHSSILIVVTFVIFLITIMFIGKGYVGGIL